ncbi:MAG: hypothetical protein J6W04_02160 [Bacteroidales bacterium]|nr:hypothetical protein [Bacteroidales bacterium]
MWFVVAVFLALALLPMTVGMIVGMNRNLPRRKMLNFSILSSVTMFIFAILGILLAFVINLIADISYMYWILIAFAAALIIYQAFKWKQYAIIFYTDNKNNLLLSTITFGLDVMLASMGCYMSSKDAFIVTLCFLAFAVVFGVLGLFLGLKSNSPKTVSIPLFSSGIFMMVLTIIHHLS